MTSETTSLRLLRREIGPLATVGELVGVSKSVLQRAEVGRPVSDRARTRLEATFKMPLEELQRPFLDSIESEAADDSR